MCLTHFVLGFLLFASAYAYASGDTFRIPFASVQAFDPQSSPDPAFDVEWVSDSGYYAFAEGRRLGRMAIAWNEVGVLLRVTVHDSTPAEYPDSSQLWRGDAVDVYMADSVGSSNRYQVIIAPGRDSGRGELQTFFYDHRQAPADTATLDAKASRSLYPDGYSLALLLPWRNLGISSPREGMRVGMQVIVRDSAAGRMPYVCTWYPDHRTFKSSVYMHTLVLHRGDVPSQALRSYVHKRNYERAWTLDIKAPLRLAGEGLDIWLGKQKLANVRLKAKGGLSMATMPLKKWKPTSGNLVIKGTKTISDTAVVFEELMGRSTHAIAEKPMNNMLFLPDGYSEDSSKKWPLILYLHGKGQSGNDFRNYYTQGFPTLMPRLRHLEFIIAMPQRPIDTVYKHLRWSETHVMPLLDTLLAQYRIDTSRIYLTGQSMGGFGTWHLGALYPDRFAAIAPLAGGGDSTQACALVKTPVWAFHGKRDPLVPIRFSIDMIEALRRCGGSPKLTVYPDQEHYISDTVYMDSRLYEWFLEHSRRRSHAAFVRPLPHRAAPPTIDGDLSDWDRTGALILGGGRSFESKGSGAVQMAWDTSGIYFAARVFDDSLWNASPDTTQYWNGDGISLYIDARPDSTRGNPNYSPAVKQIVIRPCSLGTIAPGATIGSVPQPNIERSLAALRDSVGWTLEGRIPWELFPGFDAQAGRVVHLNVELADSDGGDERKSAVTRFNRDGENSHFRDPSPWAPFRLSSGSAGLPFDFEITERLWMGEAVLEVEAHAIAASNLKRPFTLQANGLRETLDWHSSASGKFVFLHQFLRPGVTANAKAMAISIGLGDSVAVQAEPACPILASAATLAGLQAAADSNEALTSQEKNLVRLYISSALEAMEDANSGDKRRMSKAQKHYDLLTKYARKVVEGSFPQARSAFFVHRSFTSRLDGSLQPLRIQAPKALDAGRRYPLLVRLHGWDRVGYSRRYFLGSDLAEFDTSGRAPAGDDSLFTIACFARGNTYFPPGQEEMSFLFDSLIHTLPIDTSRIYLMGGSLGAGNGLRHIVLHPDRFAGAYLSSGFYRRDSVVMAVEQWRERYYRPFDRLGNLKATRIGLAHSSGDRSCPVEGSRMLHNLLREQSVATRYREVNLKQHGVPADSIRELHSWLFQARRLENPDTFTITAVTAKQASAWGATIERFKRADTLAFLSVQRDPSTNSYRITTTNVAAFSLTLPSETAITVRIDGSSTISSEKGRKEPRAWFAHDTKQNRWSAKRKSERALAKGADASGPLEDIQSRRFALVYGTRDPRLTEVLRRTAVRAADRLVGYDLGQWGAGRIAVVSDTSAASLGDSISLILIGSPEHNRLSAKWASKFPISFHKGGFSFLGRKYQKPHQSVRFLYPHPRSPSHYVIVVAANSPEGYGSDLFEDGHLDYAISEHGEPVFGGLYDPDWQATPSTAWEYRRSP